MIWVQVTAIMLVGGLLLVLIADNTILKNIGTIAFFTALIILVYSYKEAN